MTPRRYLPRRLPEKLTGLADLAMDLRWSWNHAADELWRTVDPGLWELTGNPWLILQSVAETRLEALAADRGFLAELDRLQEARRNYLEQPTWFAKSHGHNPLTRVAYFSMEFGLGEALPIYSGGLGILAGDHLKTASDLGVPVTGIGLLYQQGYFRQVLDAQGEQIAIYPYNDPAWLPVMPLRDSDGEWLRVTVELPGRPLHLRAWEVRAGRVRLCLLDSNDPLNTPSDRGITAELYAGGPELRLQQELALGIGGWRLIEKLGEDPEVCHLNEGHAAFAVLERARGVMQRMALDFATALRLCRAGNVFTTHTPVAAGFDRFAPALFKQYLGAYAAGLGVAADDLSALGRADPADPSEPFNMAYLAVRGSGRVNGVSRLHGEVSRHIFLPLFPRWPPAEVPVGHVTNGVHVPSWDSAAADALWHGACGHNRWSTGLETVERDFRCLDDRALWSLRGAARRELVEKVRWRLARQLSTRGAGADVVEASRTVLDPNVCTLGFARRFAAYKRPNLLLHDSARLTRLLTQREQPLQIVIAGKAHPRDEEGRSLLHAWTTYAQHAEVRQRLVFVEDYDMAVAEELVQGVDLWLNTPRRPWEASGTSGMKVLVNGGLNLSELDGWWAEAYCPEVGWALGDGQEHADAAEWDAREAEALYTLLEQEVLPAFYTRNGEGMPERWLNLMRESMARLTPHYSANRMLREYTKDYYLPAAAAYRRRLDHQGALARELETWRRELHGRWHELHIGEPRIVSSEAEYRFEVPIYLGGLDPASVCPELYAEAADAGPPERIALVRGDALSGAAGGYLYAATVARMRPQADYTVRIVPHHADAGVPLEEPLILWQH